MIIRRMGGVNPQPDMTLKFDPVALDEELDFFELSNLTVQGTSVEVKYDKTEGYRAYVDGELSESGFLPSQE